MSEKPDFRKISGLEALQWMQEHNSVGRPFIGDLLGINITDVEPGRVCMEIETRPNFSNPLGTVHGGIFATLLDSVMACAIHTTLGAGVGYTTLELKVNFIRTLPLEGERMIGEGTVIHSGSRTATAEGKVHDAHGKLLAHATTTCLILK